MTMRRVAGLAVAFAGVALVVALGTGETLSLASAKGPLLVVFAPLSFALYNVLLKPLFARYDLLALTAATSLVGILGLLPFLRSSTAGLVTGVSARDASFLLYLGVLATLLGYVLWNVGLRGIGPTRAVAYTYAISPLAVVIGAIVLDEPVTPWLALGGALVVGGIATAQGVSLPKVRSGTFGRWRSAFSRSAS
jgi:drug/metabolite transporter (DMT)-like permease